MFPWSPKKITAVPAFQGTLDRALANNLGNYVYALVDPLDGLPFYVGQGRSQRPYAHLREAANAEAGRKPHCAKTERIVAIWRKGRPVRLHVLRRNLPEEALDDVEGAIIEALGLWSKVELTNRTRGNHAGRRGVLKGRDLRRLRRQSG